MPRPRTGKLSKSSLFHRAPKVSTAPASSWRTRRATDRQRLLTGGQIEETYGIPYRSMYDLVTRGVVKPVRFPGSRRLWFERAALEELITRSREGR
jgi:hypothetical protein